MKRKIKKQNSTIQNKTKQDETTVTFYLLFFNRKIIGMFYITIELLVMIKS